MSSVAPEDVLSEVSAVDIDDRGIFKYILIDCSLKGARKTILRGYGTEEYHGNVVFRRCGPPPDCAAVRREAEAGCEIALTATVADDILQRVARPLRVLGIKCSCPGGGRIRHGVQELFVYGYSQAYGPGDHALAVEMLKEAYPSYGDRISFSNEGY